MGDKNCLLGLSGFERRCGTDRGNRSEFLVVCVSGVWGELDNDGAASPIWVTYLHGEDFCYGKKKL